MSPAISVVVATHNRRHLLPRLADALEAQVGAPQFEVIIVDDGSTDGSSATLDDLASERGARLDLRMLCLDRNAGPAAARNAGWRAARAPLVAFTDDDCTPQPAWLAAIVAGLARTEMAQGRTTRNPTQRSTGWFSWAPETDSDGPFYETCNMGYRRTVLEEIGGFDESFLPLRPRRASRGAYVPPVWGEDTDLALRAKAAGATSVFVGDAVVWHDVKPGRLRDRLRDLPRRSGTVHLVKRHPQLREELESRWFVQRAHGTALASAVAIGHAVRRRGRPTRWVVAALLVAVWARERGVHYPPRVWARVLPQWFVVDLVEVGVLAAASARERTLLL
jgi:glycosyltransferase involved in cell wall biosynthesis